MTWMQRSPAIGLTMGIKHTAIRLCMIEVRWRPRLVLFLSGTKVQFIWTYIKSVGLLRAIFLNRCQYKLPSSMVSGFSSVLKDFFNFWQYRGLFRSRHSTFLASKPKMAFSALATSPSRRWQACQTSGQSRYWYIVGSVFLRNLTAETGLHAPGTTETAQVTRCEKMGHMYGNVQGRNAIGTDWRLRSQIHTIDKLVKIHIQRYLTGSGGATALWKMRHAPTNTRYKGICS